MLPISSIFYSLAGEGFHTGKAALFIRFARCNIPRCSFCDSNFVEKERLTDIEIVGRLTEILDAYSIDKFEGGIVVFTGGEPTMHDLKDLILELRFHERFPHLVLCIETNGTINAEWLARLDFITVSPKDATLKIDEILVDEVKLVVSDNFDEKRLKKTEKQFQTVPYLYLQPDNNRKEMTAQCIDIIKRNPNWRLSLQTQKIVNIE